MSRPRPVELAVAFDDGTALSTLINPQRDLADARKAFGISVSDVLLAPTLREAWAVIAPMLAGCTPVGVGVDETLGLIDFELKRLGYVTAMPLGVELRGTPVIGPHRAGASPSALDARTAACRHRGRLVAVRGTRRRRVGFGSAGEPRPLGAAHRSPITCRGCRRCCGSAATSARCCWARLVDRDLTPRRAVGRGGAAVGGRPAAGGGGAGAAAEEVAARLQEASRCSASTSSRTRCRAASRHRRDAWPRGRICFTGTAQDSAGRIVERPEMERLAAGRV